MTRFSHMLLNRQVLGEGRSVVVVGETALGSVAWIDGKRLEPGDMISMQTDHGEFLVYVEPPADSPFRVPDDVAEEMLLRACPEGFYA